MRFGGIPWCLVRCFQGVFSGGLWISDWLSGLCGLVGRLGLVCARETGIPCGSTGVLCVGGFLWVWVYIRNPRERGARPGVLVTVNAAACYSPTSSRVQYHRRARP